MTDDALARDEAPPSPAKRLIVGTGILVVLVAAGVFVYMLMKAKVASPVCDHVAEIGKTNPREAEQFVDAIVSYVMSHASKDVEIKGNTDERCHNAMGKLADAYDDAKVRDCLVRAATAGAARTCLPVD